MNISNVFLLLGPTGTGKTDVAIELAKQFPIEIVSVDSAMVYSGMNIGTAKPEKDILESIPHHMINVCLPSHAYSVASFYEEIQTVIEGIQACGKVPLLVGGTMMYFNALLKGLAHIPAIDANIRTSLLDRAQKQGTDVLHQELMQCDKASAVKIHSNDLQRTVRALEVYRGTGKPLSVWLQDSAQRSLLTQWKRVHAFAIQLEDRSSLHGQLELRLANMFEQGFIEEVIDLKKKYNLSANMPAMRSIGYRQILSYLEGKYNYSTLIAKTLVATRQLAKHQSTWLRHWSACPLSTYPTAKDALVAMQKEFLKIPQYQSSHML